MIMLLATLLALSFALSASASTIDPKTGIAFETFSSPKGYSFGLAVPTNVTTEFIGQLVIPSTGVGYGGISLGGSMTNSLLIVTWANSGSIKSSFRYTTTHASPSVYSAKPSLSMSPIANGTYVNSTHLSYTFLCTACITGDSLSFSPTSSTIQLGWSRSTNAVTNPATPTGATFAAHNIGAGTYSLNLTAAKSPQYSTWAAMAVKPAVLLS